MSLELISLLAWLPFLVLALIFGILFSFLGAKRGTLRAAISLGATVVSTIISVILAKMMAGPIASKLLPMIRDMVGDSTIWEAEHFAALVRGCAAAAASLVLFIPCYILVLIILKNLTTHVFTKKLAKPAETESKMGGLLIGLVDALLLSFLLLLPVYGTLHLGGNVYTAVSSFMSLEGENNEEAVALPIVSLNTDGTVRPVGMSMQSSVSDAPSYDELVKALCDTPLSDLAGLPLFKAVYNEMASFTHDGDKVKVAETIDTVTKVATAVSTYQKGEEGAKEAMLSAITHLEEVVTDNSFYAGLACDVIAQSIDSEDGMPVQYAGFSDKTVLQQDATAIFTVARAAVESDLLGELMSDKPDLSKVDVKAFSSGIATALNSTESIAQLKADLVNSVIDEALKSVAGDDEEKLASLRETIGTVDAAPLTGEALAAEGDSLYLIMNAALTMATGDKDASLSGNSKAAGDLIEGLARHPSFGVDKVVDVAGAILDVSGTAGGNGTADETVKESIKETLKDALNASVSKPVGEATFGEFVGTTASAAEILTQIQNGTVNVETMEQILNAKADVLQQLEETLTGELLASLGLEGEASDVMVSLAHAIFGSIRENDMTAAEKKAEAEVLSDALTLIFNIGKSSENEDVKATAYTLANSYLDSKILCATAKSLADKGADPFGLELGEDDKAEIRTVFLEAIDEFSSEDSDAAEKIGYLATLMGITLH